MFVETRRGPVGMFLVVAALLSTSILAGGCQSNVADEESAFLSVIGRNKLAGDLFYSLRADLLEAWYPRVVDVQHGGFLTDFDHEWTPTEPQNKMIVSQARHTWTTARASLFFPNDTTFLPIASHGFRFLHDVMWDDEHGGFHWMVTREGQLLPDQTGQIIKQAYGNAFGIYALAAYYEASQDPEALAFAQRAFTWLDQHAHDPIDRGYFQFMERDGTAIRTGYNGVPPKDQNSSIHLLEAFTELYRVWPDSILGERLKEMLLLIRDTITTEPGTLTLFSTADWQPISYRDSAAEVREANHYRDHVSFGHDVETAYLLLEAAELLDLEVEETLETGKRMVDHALQYGWDRELGGFYDAGSYLPDRSDVTIVRDTKNWWAQAEGLNTLLLMGDHFPDDPMNYHKRFLELWTYVQSYLIDHEYGGWYRGGLDKEPELSAGTKAGIWKAAYHDARSMMNCITRLRTT